MEVSFGTDNKTVTDAQGRFTLEGVEPGEASLYFGDFFGNRKVEVLPDYLLERFPRCASRGRKNDRFGRD